MADAGYIDVSTPEPVARYIAELFAPEDDALRAIRTAHATAELPEIHVSAVEGKLLQVLLHAIGAHRVLEVGTLGGYSAIWMARALPTGGTVTTIEGNERHAAFAREAVTRAQVADRVEIIGGEALDTLATLPGPFDAVFLDADKAPLPQYFAHAMRLLRRGGLLACDNTFMDGHIVEDDATSSDVEGMREFNRLAATDRRLVTAVIPERDGLLVAIKVGD